MPPSFPLPRRDRLKWPLMLVRGAVAIPLLASLLGAQPAANPLLAALTRHAAAFHDKARDLISEEKLLQRSYATPPHAHFAIGAAAEPLRASFQVHEVVSEYSFGKLKGDTSGAFVELREILEKDGKSARTPAAARKALQLDVSSGEARARKMILEEFTGLGLVDVATDYALILLAFTPAGIADLTLSPSGSAWVGTDETLVFDWQQTRGGALEFRGRQTARRALSGRIWLRGSDGMPLRITASFAHSEPKHELQDDATVEFAPALGCPLPVSVVHRHSVDGRLLTENLYTYAPFRVFSTDTTIEYGTPPKRLE
jgi:hypothetical protein